MELKDELAAVKDEQLATKEELVTTKDQLKMLEKEVTILRDPPHLHMCGSYNGGLSNYNSSTITFSKLLYSATNTEGGGLDITSGVFTAPWGGSYTVTWSINSVTYGSHTNFIYLYKNSNKVQESLLYSHNSDPSYYVNEQGNNYY